MKPGPAGKRKLVPEPFPKFESGDRVDLDAWEAERMERLQDKAMLTAEENAQLGVDLDLDDEDNEDDDAPRKRRRRQRRKVKVGVPRNLKGWISSSRMTHTELSLRLALHLLTNKLVSSDVVVSLGGYELRRRGAIFPVVDYLNSCGWERADVEETGQSRKVRKKKTTAKNYWVGMYTIDGLAFALELNAKPANGEGNLSATLATGQRLVVEMSGGLTVLARGPAQHRILWAAIGRAITTEHAEPNDVIAVAVPRSSRFRRLAELWREAPRVADARLRIVTVDRMGVVNGLT